MTQATTTDAMKPSSKLTNFTSAGSKEDCRPEVIKVKMPLSSATVNAHGCVNTGKYVRIARYESGGTGDLSPYIYASVGSDPAMYPLDLPTSLFRSNSTQCDGYEHCFEVIPGTDTLIIESSKANGWLIFNNLSERLTFSNGRYSLNVSNPYDQFSPSGSYSESYPGGPRTYSYQRGYGYSENG